MINWKITVAVAVLAAIASLAAAGGRWYAACDTGHRTWFGPVRATYKVAKEDAVEHDRTSHSGRKTAGVLGP